MHWHVRKRVATVTAVVVLMLLSIWAKALWESRENLQMGKRYLQAKDDIRAITFFDRSLRWYTLLSPFVAQSAQHLWEIALRAEQNGDTRLALIALRTIRRGCYASRSFYTPRADIIRQCNGKILSLMPDEQAGQEQELNQATLPGHRNDSEPDVFWSCILEVGLIGWIGSVFGFLLSGLTRGPTTCQVSRLGMAWGVVLVISYALWILGMMRA